MSGALFKAPLVERPTVGDWVETDTEGASVVSVLARRSLLKRAAPDGSVQPIAANVDTLFIVTSCNQEFNASRLERYVAVAMEAQVMPVVVLTKIDEADDVAEYVRAASVRPGLMVEAVNGLDTSTLDGVRSWCAPGQTVALVGSSGVGKSTLLNALAGSNEQAGRRPAPGPRAATVPGPALRTSRAPGRETLVPGAARVVDDRPARAAQLAALSRGPPQGRRGGSPGPARSLARRAAAGALRRRVRRRPAPAGLRARAGAQTTAPGRGPTISPGRRPVGAPSSKVATPLTSVMRTGAGSRVQRQVAPPRPSGTSSGLVLLSALDLVAREDGQVGALPLRRSRSGR